MSDEAVSGGAASDEAVSDEAVSDEAASVGCHAPRSVALIEDHGLLGDTRTAALVDTQGVIDWMCIPRFDGHPIFASLVGGDDGGTFRMGPLHPTAPVVRRYHDDSATIETAWDIDGGRLVLTEGMVAEVSGGLLPSTLLVRRLEATGAPVQAAIEIDPRLGDAHRRPRVRRDNGAMVCSWRGAAIAVSTSPNLEIHPGQLSMVTVIPGQPVTIALAVAYREPLVYVDADAAWGALVADEERWQNWCAGIDLDLPRRKDVIRSLLTLRLLTYSPSGAPVAAPTTSLPEEIGGSRNWDYRYAWPRDASIGIAAFLAVGKQEEARRFMAWLLHASRLERPHLPVLFTLDGRNPEGERELQDWPGYRDSRPVRRGNGASDQHQLDGYGWVIDAAWLLSRSGNRLYSETWRAIAGFADTVANRWQEPDAGIWEVRSDQAHHVHSKVMAWLALDRALRIAEDHRTSASRLRLWDDQRTALGEEIVKLGYDDELATFTRTYGSSDVDSALLVLPIIGLEPEGSARTVGTIAAIRKELAAGGPLLFRYLPGKDGDGLPGTEGAFLPCSFWLVQALAATGSMVEAQQLFDELLELASPLGLYAEEMDPTTREHLGNFPQALTHAALVQAALAIRDAGSVDHEE